MGVQFWPSVSFTYYNESLAYANHKPEPSPGAFKRCWMIRCSCWRALAVLWTLALASSSSLGWLAPGLVPGQACVSLCGEDCWIGFDHEQRFFEAKHAAGGQTRFLGSRHKWQPPVIHKSSWSKIDEDLQTFSKCDSNVWSIWQEDTIRTKVKHQTPGMAIEIYFADLGSAISKNKTGQSRISPPAHTSKTVLNLAQLPRVPVSAVPPAFGAGGTPALQAYLPPATTEKRHWIPPVS